jgi:hypothetical protein
MAPLPLTAQLRDGPITKPFVLGHESAAIVAKGELPNNLSRYLQAQLHLTGGSQRVVKRADGLY